LALRQLASGWGCGSSWRCWAGAHHGDAVAALSGFCGGGIASDGTALRGSGGTGGVANITSGQRPWLFARCTTA